MGSKTPFYPRKTRRRKEYRWLRSNGTPDFSDHIHYVPGDMEIIAKKPVLQVTPNTPLIKALEIMAENYRSLLVVQNNKLYGLLLATHIINYLGGGEYYRIIETKHRYNIYSALEKEPVSSIMEDEPIVGYIDEKLPHVLEKMVLYNIGLLPIVYRDNTVYGVVAEHDLVKYLYGVVAIGVEVDKIMSSPVVTIDEEYSIKKAVKKMVSYGFRRLPVVEDNMVIGMFSAMDLIRYFNPHKLFKTLSSSDIRSVLEKPVKEVMSREVVIVEEKSDLGSVVNTMLEKDVSSALIVNKDMELIGIVTERDILYALTVREIR